jgi:hypothetical protein
MSDCFKASNTMIKRLSVCTFALLMLVLLLNGVTSVKTAAQASTWPPLPAPIIFYDFQGRLIYVDPHTQTSRFFRVLRYSLSQQKLSVVYEPAGGEYTPSDPSSVDEMLEGAEAFVYLLRPAITDVYNAPLGLLINGEVYQLNLPYAAATFPIWSIDLSVPLAMPTPAPN